MWPIGLPVSWLVFFLLSGVPAFASAEDIASVPQGNGDASRELPSVAILDFESEETTSGPKQQIGAGFSDLLVVALSSEGIPVVDRGLIRAVLAEHRLSDKVLIDEKSRLAAGRLLGARFLLHGHVTVLSNRTFEIRAQLTAVTEIGVYGLVDSRGSYPEGLEEATRLIARDFATKIGCDKENGINARSKTSLAALTVFYQGLESCAQGRPEEGVGRFLDAQKIDPEFLEAKAWECKAYQLAGFDGHAEIVRAELLKRPGSSNFFAAISAAGSATSDARIVSFVLPVIETPALRGGSMTADELRHLLVQAAVKVEHIRVFDNTLLNKVAREFDQTLNDDFDASSAPRYGRWLGTEGIVFSRIVSGVDGRPVLLLQLRNPMSGEKLAEVEKSGFAFAVQEINAVVGELLSKWKEQRGCLLSGQPFREIKLSEHSLIIQCGRGRVEYEEHSPTTLILGPSLARQEIMRAFVIEHNRPVKDVRNR